MEKEWIEKAFNAGRNAGYWEQDPDGCREVFGYFSFDEWLKFIKFEEKESTIKKPVCPRCESEEVTNWDDGSYTCRRCQKYWKP